MKPNQSIIDKINNMSHIEMARLWRYAPNGHIYFDPSQPYFEVFEKRYNMFGGMTPEISKELGWS